MQAALHLAFVVAFALFVQGSEALRRVRNLAHQHNRPLPRMTPFQANTNTLVATATGTFNVMDYGAKGDNATDNTGPFSDALAAAEKAGGGVVFAPPGIYRFRGSLSVGQGVTLQGSYASVPSHDLRGGSRPDDGTVLVPLDGRGTEVGAFITLVQNSHLAGVCIWYAEQEMTATPVPYPWSVHMVANNAALTDTELLGAWQGVNATGAHRHYIARVQGEKTFALFPLPSSLFPLPSFPFLSPLFFHSVGYLIFMQVIL